MGKNTHQTKADFHFHEQKKMGNEFGTKARLNLNDLLRRRKEEKQVDKRSNIRIISGVSVAAATVVLILSL
tara:strand:+ start:171 stop:383 length:213 start_codon:yes stop_codon:yes gene_type:complete